jgi:hypothetical protein
MVQILAGLDAVNLLHPARDLRLASATVFREDVAGESRAVELFLRYDVQRALTRNPGDIGCRHARASRSKPRNAVGGVRNNAVAQFGEHSTIVPPNEGHSVPGLPRERAQE